MTTTIRTLAIALTSGAILAVAACGGHDKTATANGDVGNAQTVPATTPTYNPPPADTTTTHHSKLAGAAAGAAAGHMLGGHAVLGAAAGALIQHERNKHGK